QRAIRRVRGRISGACASSPRATVCASSRWGLARTTGSPPRRERPTSASEQSWGSAHLGGAMGLSDVWARTLVYFGSAEEEDWDEDGYLAEDELADPYERQNTRQLPARPSPRPPADARTDPPTAHAPH